MLNWYLSATETFCQCAICLREQQKRKNVFILEDTIAKDNYGRTPLKMSKPYIIPVGN